MTRRALVVDDDRSMVKTLAEILELKGLEVAQAYTGVEAVQAASRESFDVVLMDIKMPGMDGVDAFKAMKAAQPGIRVILMTAFAAQDRVVEAEREGVIRVLPKPVNIPGLLSLLTDSMNRQRPVLLIDEDEAFLKTLSDVLRTRGFDVVVAEDLDHATRVMAEARPVAVLLHMHLGTRSAREAVLAVHEMSPAVALILYSGEPDAERELERELPPEWVHTYLQKPFVIDQVTGVLDAIRGHG